jgi:uncharacterized protein YjbI with pentapeptide repeats
MEQRYSCGGEAVDKDEVLALLKTDVARFNEMRRANFQPLDLSHADLAGADLKGADLRRTDFTGASLRKADLSDAELVGCSLEGADFRDANLQGASLHHSNLRGADLRGAAFTPLTPRGRLCLNPASFQGTRWDKSHLEQILQVLNGNGDWEIRYEIVPKARQG